MIAVHLSPVWRDRANFIVRAAMEEPGDWEQLWARQIGEDQFEICCVPFFIYDLALGDVVQTDDEYLVTGVVARSGLWVFRIMFVTDGPDRETICGDVEALGGQLEWYSSNVVAIDTPDAATAQAVADRLDTEEPGLRLHWETGRS